MTALGGLDGLSPVASATRPSPRRPSTDPSMVDALSGPDGTADPAPWPADTGGLTAVGDVFPDALTVDLGPAPAPSERPSTQWPPTDRPPTERLPTGPPPTGAPRSMQEVAAAAPELRAARPAQNTRAPVAQRAARNTWSASSGRPGQNAARPAPAAARRTPPAAARRTPQWTAPSAPFAPARPAARPTAQNIRPTGQLARPTGERSQWGSQQSPRPTRSTDPRVRRRSRGSAVFAVLFLAAIILFASGGAEAIIHLLTTLSGR